MKKCKCKNWLEHSKCETRKQNEILFKIRMKKKETKGE